MRDFEEYKKQILRVTKTIVICASDYSDEDIPSLKNPVLHAQDFLETLCKRNDCYRPKPNDDGIYPTDYNTVIIEITTNRGIVSIEFGKNKLGWFTDFADGNNSMSEGENYSEDGIFPEILYNLIKKE